MSFGHLRVLLAEAGLSFQRTRTWKASPDPDYEPKAARILDLCAKPPPAGVVISFDQWDRSACARPPVPAGRPKDAPNVAQLNSLLASNRRGDAVRLFMRHVGMPAPLVSLMRLMPAWSKLKRVAHTLPYDGEIMGDTQLGRPLPEGRWPGTKVKTLVIVGGKSPAFFHNGTSRLVDLLPNAEHRVLAGQTHMVKAKALAPALIDYFAAGRAPSTDRAEQLVPNGLGNTAA